jgi:glucose/arabinose dehydrogenase
MIRTVLALSAFVLLSACGGAPPPDQGYGADVALPEPQSSALPTINTARPVGWAEGAAPVAPEGFNVTRYAEGLSHPRWVYLLPNNDVLVAHSASRPAQGGGIVGWIRNRVQRGAGAYADDGIDRVTLLRDTDLDGDVDETHVFKDHLNQPFGMLLVNNYIYIANTDAVLRYPYSSGVTRLGGAGEIVMRFPVHEGDNGHWTRNLIANEDGTKIYASVGSASNIADHGIAAEEGRAAIWEFNPDGTEARVFATGLRNPVGMAWSEDTLWVAVNERDMLGDNLVPDYMTSVKEGGFYGWPYSYYGQNVDTRVTPQNAELVASALTPDYALGAHTASLGLHIYSYDAFPEHYWGGAFVGQHGSWNRSEPAGYKVIFVPFEDGEPSGAPEDFLTGFLDSRGRAQGRPVGVAMDQTGALLVADDVGGIIWRVAHAD